MKLRPVLFVAGGTLCLMGLFIVCAVVAFVYFVAPTNDRDNASQEKRAEMVQLTLKWGRLAPFPTTAKDFTIYTEGNLFTRTFRGSFSDTPENIRGWLQSSVGVTEGERQGSEIVLKMGEGASYGVIVVSPDDTEVTFRVSWS